MGIIKNQSQGRYFYFLAIISSELSLPEAKSRDSQFEEKVNNMTFIYFPVFLSVSILVETHGDTISLSIT